MLPIVQLEHEIANYEQLELETTHNFYNGLYARSIYIPAGALIVGKRHRQHTLNILMKGRMVITDGDSSFEVCSPYMVETLPMTKKAAYALENSIWTNIHVTSETDLDELEKMFIIPEEEYNNLIKYEGATKCLG